MLKALIDYVKSDVLLPTKGKDDLDELKTFGLTFAIAIPLVFALVLPFVFSAPSPMWPMYVSLILVLGYFFLPKWLYYPYRVWMFVGSILAWLNTKLILAIAYFIMMLPLGLILRLMGKLDYQHRPSGSSFWQTPTRRNTSRKARLKEPF